jgi:hypothetical protein
LLERAEEALHLFPKGWDNVRIKREVDAAFENKTISATNPNKWEGYTPSGVKVTGYLTPRVTAYPLRQ